MSERSSRIVLPFTDASAPPAVARAVITVASLMLLGTLVFLVFGRTDVVIKGPARVVPSTEAARIQALRGGTVARIAVRNGDAVAPGDILLELDVQEHEGRLVVLRAQLDAAELRIRTLEQLLESRADLFTSEGDLRSVESRVAAAQLEAAREREVAVKLDRELSQLGRVRTESLAEQGALSTKDVEDAQRIAQVAEADAARARAGVRELRSELQRLSIEKKRAGQSAIVAALQDRISLAEAQERHATLRGLVAETELLVEQSRVRSPTAGVLQDLSVHNSGEVVNPGDVLGWIVPTDEGLMVEVEVPATGVGFITEGQQARVKLDAYPYQEYGTMEGEVVWLSADAARDPGSGSRAGYFEARLSIGNRPLDEDGAPLPLRAGMTGTGELVVREDRIITTLVRTGPK